MVQVLNILASRAGASTGLDASNDSSYNSSPLKPQARVSYSDLQDLSLVRADPEIIDDIDWLFYGLGRALNPDEDQSLQRFGLLADVSDPELMLYARDLAFAIVHRESDNDLRDVFSAMEHVTCGSHATRFICIKALKAFAPKLQRYKHLSEEELMQKNWRELRMVKKLAKALKRAIGEERDMQMEISVGMPETSNLSFHTGTMVRVLNEAIDSDPNVLHPEVLRSLARSFILLFNDYGLREVKSAFRKTPFRSEGRATCLSVARPIYENIKHLKADGRLVDLSLQDEHHPMIKHLMNIIVGALNGRSYSELTNVHPGNSAAYIQNWGTLAA